MNPKKYDLVTVLGVTGCVLSFFLILFFGPKGQPPSPQPVTVSQSAVPAEPVPGGADAPGLSLPPAAPGSLPAAVPAAAYDPLRPAPSSALERLQLRQEGDFSAALDPAYGGIDQLILDQHSLRKSRNGDDNGGPVVLGQPEYPFLRLLTEVGGWTLEPGSAERQNDQSIILEQKSSDGNLLVQQRWAVDQENSYAIKYTISIRNLAERPLAVQNFRVECGALPPLLSEPGKKAGMGESSGGVAYGQLLPDGRIAPAALNIKDLSKKMTQEKLAACAAQPGAWLSVHSKYFLLYIKADFEGGFSGYEPNATPGVTAEGLVSSNGQLRYHARAILPASTLAAGQEVQYQLSAYSGPKDIKRLHAMGGRLDSIMEMDRFFFWNFAWMGWLSRALLAAMVWISKLFPVSIGYGMGVVGVTLLVKILFWPLNHRSTVSMRRMSALSPYLKELREKYKEDPQKMYRKQQELFKANHVSQLGGCMPMLCQIPVFFALFNTFRNAIELRHAGFLWAVDLSMPDDLFFSLFGLPIRPLALLMGLTMYFQQKLTPSADPQQAKMMNMMSLVFIFFFYGMPSALTLYMTVNQVLSIAQMLVIRKLESKKDSAEKTVVIPWETKA
ncbi:MAG: membrane protein insertase YidC [Oligosphaeraceae bacterium]|nr:membrane protein insertase YidC [Oligosphaeraceae bacterium]